MQAATLFNALTGWKRLLPFAPAGSDVTDVLVSIGRLAQSLDELTRRTEPGFVELTDELKALYTCAMDLGGTTRTRVASIQGALNGSDSVGCRQMAEGAVAKLRARLEETAVNLESLRHISGALRELRGKGCDLERLATVLQVSRYALAVECGRTAERRETFFEFVGELEALGQQIRSLGVQVSEDADAVQAELGLVMANTRSGLTELHKLTGRSSDAAGKASGEAQHVLDSAWSVLSGAEQNTQAILRHAEEAGYYLQFGDIVRQKLEHVHAALRETSGPGRILAIQAAQLSLIESEIGSAAGRLEETFSGLARETDVLAGRMQALASGEDGASSGHAAFDEVETSLLELQKLEKEGASLCSQARVMSERARGACTGFSRHLQTVELLNHRMHLQALNAIVKTAHLQEAGGTLGILSMHVDDLARQSDGIAQQTIGVLETLQDQPHAAGDSERFAAAETNLGSGLDRIRHVREELRAAAEASLRLAAEQRARLEETRERLKFLARFASDIAGFSSRLRDLSDRTPDPGGRDDALEQMAQRYTTASERTIHRQLMRSEPAPLDPVPAVSPVEGPEGDSGLGDNVELF